MSRLGHPYVNTENSIIENFVIKKDLTTLQEGMAVMFEQNGTNNDNAVDISDGTKFVGIASTIYEDGRVSVIKQGLDIPVQLTEGADPTVGDFAYVSTDGKIGTSGTVIIGTFREPKNTALDAKGNSYSAARIDLLVNQVIQTSSGSSQGDAGGSGKNLNLSQTQNSTKPNKSNNS